MRLFGLSWKLRPSFTSYGFFFYSPAHEHDFTVHGQKTLFIHCSRVPHTIHKFKNYFVTVFSVFSNKWYLNRLLISFKIILKGINIPFFGSFQGHGLVPNGLREGKLTCLQETNYSSTLIESRSLLYSMAVTLARNLSK